MDKFTAMKREPCHKCQQPVFLAERFCVGAALYHRQCLKCARCGSQLKAGSFYETEIDGEFCCETCPDEEQVMRRRDESQIGEEEAEKRFSVADKVALFQRVDLELTKKSLSDEEKRASLQRLANLTLVSQDHPAVNDVEEENENSENSSNESESDGEDEPPCDPKNLEENIENDAQTIETETQEPVCDNNDKDKIIETPIEVKTVQTEKSTDVPSSLVDLTIQALIRLEVEEIVTSVLKEAAEKVQLIKDSELTNTDKETNDHREETDKSDVVPLEVGPKPVPRVRTLDRVKKETDEEKSSEKPSKPARPPPPVVVKPPIKPRPASLAPKKVYPDDLNPFGSDEEQEEVVKGEQTVSNGPPKNPFGSDTEEEVEVREDKKKPSTNPFGSDDEDDENDPFSRETTSRDSDRSSKRTPVPTPRKIISTPPSRHTLSVQNLSQHSKTFGNHSLHGTQDIYGSSSSLAYSDGMSTAQRRKKAKAPPPPSILGIFNASESNRSSRNLDYESEESTSSRGGAISSTGNTPNKSVAHKKKRKAPAPPPIALAVPVPIPIKSEPAQEDASLVTNGDSGIDQSMDSVSLQTGTSQKLIPLSAELFDESATTVVGDEKEEDKVSITTVSSDTYRRKIVPLETTETVIGRSNMFENEPGLGFDMKQEQEKEMDQHQTNGHASVDEPPICLNKSDKGKWKRRKGPAPSIPVEVRKSIKAMSPEDIKRELEVIEVQQIGLEKQGVMLEKIIREKCEGADADKSQKNSKAVEDLIMQLFDVVNEKNEIFRKQQELMYWRKQYRLESEQKELDQEIRALMEQPEENKTDGEKAREEALIARLIEVVKQRNAVVESLETDRVREMNEDASIRRSIEKHAAKFEQFAQKTQHKLLRGKKEKKEKHLKDSAGTESKPKKKKNVFNRLIHPKHKTKEAAKE